MILLQHWVSHRQRDLRLEGPVTLVCKDQLGDKPDVHVRITNEGVIMDVVGAKTGEVYSTRASMFDEYVSPFDREEAEKKEAAHGHR